MATGRLFLVVGILGIIGTLLAQNASPPLRLVLLGQPTIALPLGVWVVLAGVAGAGTAAVLRALFRWSNYLTRQAAKRDWRSEGVGSAFTEPSAPSAPAATPSPSPRDVAGETFREPRRPNWPWSATPAPPPSSSPTGFSPPPTAPPSTSTSERISEEWDDWTVDDRDRDWEDAAPPPKTTTTPPVASAEPSPSRPEEARPEVPLPPTPSRPSSRYSYSSQQPRNSAVGRSEAIYDAEYRVIIPPYRDLTEEALDPDDADTSYADTSYADTSYADTNDLEDGYNRADEVDGFADEEEELGDEEEELGDEVFDDWEEEEGTADWPRP